MRMSVEQPLWRALTGYRVLTMLYAIGLFATAYDQFARPWVAVAYYAVLVVWTLATLPRVANAASCTKRFLAADLTVAVTGILLTPLADDARADRRRAARPCRRYGPRARCSPSPSRAAGAGRPSPPPLVAAANLVERGSPGPRHRPQRDPGLGRLHRHRLRRRGRPRLRAHPRPRPGDRGRHPRAGAARPGHPRQRAPGAGHGAAARRGHRRRGGRAGPDGRRAGGRAAHPGLRRPGARLPGLGGRRRGRGRPGRARSRTTHGGPVDLRALLAPYAGSRVSLAEPGAPVPLAPAAARELAAAVGAALDNVRRHAGERRARVDPGRGRARRGDRHRPGRRPRHPGGPARPGRGRGPARCRPVDPGPAARPRRQRRADLGARARARRSN